MLLLQFDTGLEKDTFSTDCNVINYNAYTDIVLGTRLLSMKRAQRQMRQHPDPYVKRKAELPQDSMPFRPAHLPLWPPFVQSLPTRSESLFSNRKLTHSSWHLFPQYITT